MLDFLRFSSKNIGRKRFRSFLTMLSIGIGSCSVLLISLIGQIGTSAVTAEIDSFGVGGLTVSASASASLPLGESERVLIESLPDVSKAQPILLSYMPVFVGEESVKTAVWGVGTGSGQTIDLTLLHGRLFSSSDLYEVRELCLVDEYFAQSLFGSSNAVGRSVTLTSGGQSATLRICGVVRSGGSITQSLFGEYIPYFAYLPYTTLQTILEDDGFSAIAVDVSTPGTEEQTAARILRLLEENTGVSQGYSVENMALQKERFSQLLSIVTTVLSCAAGVSLVVAGLGIMTAMLSSVGERTREIGIKKAIGASSRAILLEFLWESLLLSFTGSACGCGCALIICIMGCFFLHIGVIIRVEWIFLCIGFSLFLGAVFGVYPAVKAAKLPPVEALRA